MRLTAPPPGALDDYASTRGDTFYPKADNAFCPAPEPTLADMAEAARVALGHVGPLTIRRLDTQGTFHRLYALDRGQGEDAVLRLHVQAGRAGAMLLGPWLDGLGLPVCRQLTCDLSRTLLPLDFEIVAMGCGQTLSTVDGDEPAMVMALTELGRAVARVHGVGVEGYGWLDPRRPGHALDKTWDDFLRRRLEEHARVCRDIGAVDSFEVSVIERLFGRPSGFVGPGVLLHGDLGSHNVLWEQGRITALLDFEDAIAGDPVFDLASWATFHPEHRHGAFLTGYGNLPDRRRFWLYFLRVALAKTVVRNRFGITDRPGRPPAARRIQLALERLA